MDISVTRSNSERFVAVYLDAGLWALDQGLHDEAEDRLLAAADLLDDGNVGSTHQAVAEALRRLGVELDTANQSERAHPLFRRALELAQRALGAEHPAIPVYLHGLAVCNLFRQDFAAAEAVAREGLRVCEATGGLSLEAAALLHLLARVCEAQGRHDEADALRARGIEIYLDALTPANLDPLHRVQRTWADLWEQGRLDQAESILRRTVETLQQKFGPDDEWTACYLNNLGKLCYLQGRLVEAEPLLERAIAIQERLLSAEQGQADPELRQGYGIQIFNLARLYRDQGRYAQAEPLFQRGLDVLEQEFGSRHPWVAECLDEYVVLCRMTGNEEHAAALEARLRSIRATYQ